MNKQILTRALRRAQPLAGTFALLLPLAGCARASIETVQPRSTLLVVVTWNMHAGRGDFRRLVGDLEAGRLAAGSAENFVVLLQEAAGEDAVRLERLVAERGWSFFLVPVRHDGRRTRSNAIVSSRPIAGARAITLPQERQPRGAAVASIEVEGHRLFVASAHLENRVSWWKGGLFSDGARARQAEALVAALPRAGAGILGADLNTWLGRHEPAWEVLTRRFDDTPGFPRTSTFRSRLVLDHLLFDLPPGWQAVTHVVGDTYGSDHHPVIAIVFSAGSPTRGVCALGCPSASSRAAAR
ncbi:MAG: hypothetical protein HYY76_03590 [Acidobacteria bacterium]|nr:hypothetical protein [Acidobacteriota bacterium]